MPPRQTSNPANRHPLDSEPTWIANHPNQRTRPQPNRPPHQTQLARSRAMALLAGLLEGDDRWEYNILSAQWRPIMTTQTPKFLDQVRLALRKKHYSIRTESAYVNWIKRFILFHHKRHPQEMNTPEVEQFLTNLAVDHHLSPSSQNQALAALLFLYQQVLRQPLDQSVNAVRAKSRRRLPTVMSRQKWLKSLSTFCPLSTDG